jgi:hypothetical protein
MCNPEPKVLTLAQAAALAELDPHDICWAIEERGHCSTDNYDVLPADDGNYIVRRRR